MSERLQGVVHYVREREVRSPVFDGDYAFGHLPLDVAESMLPVGISLRFEANIHYVLKLNTVKRLRPVCHDVVYNMFMPLAPAVKFVLSPRGDIEKPYHFISGRARQVQHAAPHRQGQVGHTPRSRGCATLQTFREVPS